MAVLIPTKKIPQLTAYGTALLGTEAMEISVIGTSRRITTRDFVLPLDSVLTVTPFGVPGSNARQLTEGVGIVFVDGGPGGTLEINATGAVAGPANPTALVGLAPVNGAAITYMRSDAAPALSQAIAPTWTDTHIFSAVGDSGLQAAIRLSSGLPQINMVETDGAADNRVWVNYAQGENLFFGTSNDAGSGGNAWLTVNRTGIVVDAIGLTSTALTWNGNPILSTATAFANPTGTIGLAAVNGVATTALRSDAAPPLSQAIAPTWTAQHIFSLSGATNAAIFASSAQPQIDWNETDGAANNRRWRLGVQGEQFLGQVVNDANSATANWLTIDRSLNVIDGLTLGINTVSLAMSGTLLSTAGQFRSTRVWALNNLTNYGVVVTSADPAIALVEEGVTVNNGIWDIAAIGEQLVLRAVTDGVIAVTNWMTVDRTGGTIDAVTFPSSQVVFSHAQSAGAPTSAIYLNSNAPAIGFRESDAAADNRLWDIIANTESLSFRVSNDAISVVNTWMQVDRTGAVVDSVTFPAREIFTLVGDGSTGSAIDIASSLPQWNLRETDAAADNRVWSFSANAEQLRCRLSNDAGTVVTPWLTVDRTGTTLDMVALPASGDNVFIVGGAVAVLTGYQMGITAGGTRGALVAKGDNTTAAAAIAAWNPSIAGDNVFMAFGSEAAFTTRGSITYNRGAGLTAYNTTSDSKYKKNIRDSREASDIIDSIRVRAFDWKDSDYHLEHWLVAQELNEVYPMAVTAGGPTTDWAIDPSKLVPLIVKELQSIRRRLADADI